MKTLTLLLFTTICFGQAGINTTSPTETLDVNGTMRVRDLPNLPTEDRVLVADIDGVIGYKSVSTGTALLKGVMNISEWRGEILDIENVSAGIYLDDNIDLDLLINVSTGDGNTSVTDIQISVPIGILSTTGKLETTVGFYLEKNGVKLPDTEASFELNGSSGHGQAQMFYIDWITNNTGSTLTNTYALKGYINQKNSTGTTTYRFKKYNIDDTMNDNWGIEKLNARIWRF